MLAWRDKNGPGTSTNSRIGDLEARGKKFDPHLHHAVEMVETSEHEDQTVLDVYQQGYMFQDRLLRPAMVRVASQAETERD